MLLRLQKYTLMVVYCPGKKMFIADMLSRAYLHEEPFKNKRNYRMFQLTEEAQVYKEIEEIDPAKHVRLSAKGIANLRKATVQDDILSELAKVI